MAMMDWSDGFGNMMGYGGWNMAGVGLLAGLLILINIIAVIWAIADVMRPKKMDAGLRISWIIIILALQLLGVIIYLFMRGREEE